MLKITDLSYKRDYKFILSDINLTLGTGELIGLQGPNGAGKTTLLHIIIGSYKPSQGSIKYDPKVFFNSLQLKKYAGVSLEESFLYNELTIEENLQFYSALYNMKEPTRRIEELMKEFQVIERRHERISNLSKGLKKRVALMRGILHEPELWLLDEPFDGLDTLSVDILSKQMSEHVQIGGTVIFISHNDEHISKLATRRIVINNGRIQFDEKLTKNQQLFKKS